MCKADAMNTVPRGVGSSWPQSFASGWLPRCSQDPSSQKRCLPPAEERWLPGGRIRFQVHDQRVKRSAGGTRCFFNVARVENGSMRVLNMLTKMIPLSKSYSESNGIIKLYKSKMAKADVQFI